ncbi:MAG TPA: hypothetical protein VLG47_06375 [Candidatus Saccharimonadales bacterium]|nr:hypothetical protein [Candidatus Saccharimonadales bacterium]
MAGNKGDKAHGDDMFGPEPWTVWFKRHTKPVIILLVIVIAGVVLWYFMPQGHGDNSSNKVAQKTLETSLAAAENNYNYQQTVNITTQLIDGVDSGIYHADNQTLAKYHMDRATANINLKQNESVVQDLEAAAKLSPQYKKAALAFEFEIRYSQGERQQLIPLLNQIIAIEKTSSSPTRYSMIDQYQEYISDIQQNKEISF